MLKPLSLPDRICKRMRRYQQPAVTWRQLCQRFYLEADADLHAALIELIARGRVRVTSGRYYLSEHGRGR